MPERWATFHTTLMDTCIAIRTLQMSGDGSHSSRAGIVADSDPAREYQNAEQSEACGSGGMAEKRGQHAGGHRQLRLFHLQPVQYLGELGADLCISK
jgi:hypothetical protein